MHIELGIEKNKVDFDLIWVDFYYLCLNVLLKKIMILSRLEIQKVVIPFTVSSILITVVPHINILLEEIYTTKKEPMVKNLLLIKL